MISLVRSNQEVRPADGPTAVVTQYISGVIAGGELVRGQRLPPEREPVRLLGMSRPSVRAGLQSLAAKGALVIRHGAGTSVADGPHARQENQIEEAQAPPRSRALRTPRENRS
jgi:DNA-binding FadR family transcriptional regulator